MLSILKSATLSSTCSLTTQLYKVLRDQIKNGDDTRRPSVPKKVDVSRKVDFKEKLSKNLVVDLKKETDGSKTVEVFDAPMRKKKCVFCGIEDELTEKELESHYLEECQMLCLCPLCRSIVEIPFLSAHILLDCSKRHLVKKCPRCTEAIMSNEYTRHVSRKLCDPCSDPQLRCPLCHKDLVKRHESWRNHLIVDGCPGRLVSKAGAFQKVITKSTVGTREGVVVELPKLSKNTRAVVVRDLK